MKTKTKFKVRINNKNYYYFDWGYASGLAIFWNGCISWSNKEGIDATLCFE